MKYLSFFFYWVITTVIHGNDARNITLLSEKTFSLQVIEYNPPVQTDWGKIVDKRKKDLPWAKVYEVVKDIAKGEKDSFEQWYNLHSKDSFINMDQAKEIYKKNSSYYGSEEKYKKSPVSIERKNELIQGVSILNIGGSKFGVIYLKRKNGEGTISYKIEGEKWLISRKSFKDISSFSLFDAFNFSSIKELYEDQYAVKNSQNVFVPTKILQGSQLSLSKDKRKILK